MKNNKDIKWRGLFAASLAVLLMTIWAAVERTTFGWEQDIFGWVNGWSDSLRGIFLLITQLGNYWALFGITLLIVLLKKPRLALRVFGNGTLAFLLTHVYLKNLVQRPRPLFLLKDVRLREEVATSFGFPSAHTAVATALAVTLLPLFPQNWRWLVIIWILLVGVSRVYLGVHLPLDVIGGTAAGLVVVSGSMLIRGKLRTVRKITRLKLTD